MVEFEHGKAYVVDRGTSQPRYGQGLAAGLGVVMKHFRDAFGKKLDNPSETSGVFTVQYPEERLALPEAYRNFPILLYDDATGQELCTSCLQCERICPPQVIHMTQAKDPATGKPVPAVAEFLLEYDTCMSCGLCAEVCPFDAIKMDHEFELATSTRDGLTINKQGLDRPISYYAQLAPTFWDEVKESALKKLQGNIKRRSGNIGVAPQMQGEVTIQEPEIVVLEPVPETTAPADDAVAIDAKAAKLAAIRAANAAKQREAAPIIENVVLPAAEPSSTDAKAAKLAAIRAANAAKRAADQSPDE